MSKRKGKMAKIRGKMSSSVKLAFASLASSFNQKEITCVKKAWVKTPTDRRRKAVCIYGRGVELGTRSSGGKSTRTTGRPQSVRVAVVVIEIFDCGAVFRIWSTVLHFQHSWALSWLVSRIWEFCAFSVTFKHFFYNFPIFCLCFFSEPSNSVIMNLNNFTLSPNCYHKNVQLSF